MPENREQVLKGDLDTILKSYYSSQSIPEQRLQRTLGMGARHRDEARTDRQFQRVHQLWIAALVVISFAIGSLVVYRSQQDSNNTLPQNDFSPLLTAHITELVAHEVYKNHKKNQPPQIATADFNQIELKLARLPFPLAHLESQLEPQQQLLGARYCSLQGRLAVQLSLLNTDNGQQQTLYVVDKERHLRALPVESRHSVKDVQIRFWSVNGLSLILAED